MFKAEKENVHTDVISEGSVLLINGYDFYMFVKALATIEEEVLVKFNPI